MKRKAQGFAGERILELTDETEKSSLIASLISFSRAGFYPKAKHHAESGQKEEYILVYCIKGFGQAVIGQEEMDIRSGDFFFVPPHTFFKYQADRLKPWTIYWFNFNGSTAETMLKAYFKQSGSYKGSLPYSDERIQLFNTIYQNLKRGYSQHILTVLNTCLLHFLSSWVFQLQPVHKLKDKHQEVVNEAIDLMKKNLTKSISLPHLAETLNISVSSFSAIFKKKAGISPIDYYLQLKMQKACQYLEHTDVLIKEIAFKLGIDDSQYFSRQFSKIVGMSPNAYRKSRAAS